jgi:hypothetical protein
MSTPTLHGHLVTPPRSGGKSKGAKGVIEKSKGKDSGKGIKSGLITKRISSKVPKDFDNEKDNENADNDVEEVVHVQSELHKHVHFPSKDAVGESLLKVSKIIREKCIIPDDFLIDKVKFGPLAGISYEMRLLANYRSGKLELRSNNSSSSSSMSSSSRRSSRILSAGITPLCSECASEDHWRDKCSLLL